MKQIKAQIPKSWSIEIEETQKLDGILVFRDSNTNQKIYVKLCSPEDIQKRGLVFEFVDPSQLRELGVQESYIEESYNMALLKKSQTKDVFVEESAQGEQDEDFWKTPEGRKMAEEAKAKMLKNKVENAKSVVINIGSKKEDSKTSEKSPEELAEENEDLRSKLELVAQKELEKRMDFLKIPELERAQFRENPEMIKGYELAKGKSSISKEEPSGSAPLNRQQLVGSEQGFETYEEMIDALKKDKTPESEAILRKLWEKTARGMGKVRIKYPKLPEPKDDGSNSSDVKTVILGPNHGEGEESELEKWGVKVNRKRQKEAE